jgi:CxxC motif-containing protein (DUF1111 family)
MRTSPFLVGVGLLGALCFPSLLFWQSTATADEPALGGPLPGLTKDQRAAFADGRDDFVQVESAATGLGPVFNGKSCAECHAQPVVGGSSPELDVAREVRIGRIRFGMFDPLAELGGSVLQRRSIKEEMPDCPVEGERVPPEASLVSLRATPPLFGDGLIEAIPVTEILKRADPNDTNRDGISGRPNLVFNPESGQLELGRFGWKAHVSTLHLFAGDAYLNEMGITNPTFPRENLPQGQPIPPGCDLLPEVDGRLEDDGEGVDNFTNFMRFLAPPGRRFSPAFGDSGERLFQQIGCASCHTPRMGTGDNPIVALRRRSVDLFSDLLLHDMGPNLADGIVMGLAGGAEWRTTPLWGLSRRRFFLHDGRATAIDAAILQHGGEARGARDRFAALKRKESDALIAFLRCL